MEAPNMRVRPASERGVAERGWLSSRHSFSFADYYDPEHMGFRTIRVINDDTIQPGKGFGTHPHRDMEIISVVVSGALEHKDSMGNGSVIRPGEVQRMTAGTGVLHSEVNPSATEPVRLLQIWIEPDRRGLTPEYEQLEFDLEANRDRWLLLASEDGRDSSVRIHQDVSLWRTKVSSGTGIAYRTAPDRHVWLQVISGSVEVGGSVFGEGDGIAVSHPAGDIVVVGGDGGGDLLLFDLA